jgi:hypothetical protein
VKHRAPASPVSAPASPLARSLGRVALLGLGLGLALGLGWPASTAAAQAAPPPHPAAKAPAAAARIPNLSSRERALPRPVVPPDPASPRAGAAAMPPMPSGHGGRPNPHGGGAPTEPVVNMATDLAPGQIEVRVLDRRFKELGGRTVTLKVMHQSIERGNSESTVTAVTDDQGIARFDGQATESDYQYEALISEGKANYPSGPFGFSSKGGGVKVFIPMFPNTSSLNDAVILSRALLAVIPRDETFNLEVLWRIENYSQKTWIPEDVVFKMPAGFKALQAEEMQGDGRFVAAGDEAVKLEGTFPPGKHDLMFRFQLPNEGKPTLSFAFPTFLHVGFFKVMVDVSPTMTVKPPPGFSEVQETRNRDGQRRLVTGRDFLSEKIPSPSEIPIEITGIPTPSKGRSVAASLAAVIALGGMASSFGLRRRKAARSALTPEDLQRAEELLMTELIELEQAFARGSIGRKMRDRTHQQLLEAFARLSTAEGAPAAEAGSGKASKAPATRSAS